MKNVIMRSAIYGAIAASQCIAPAAAARDKADEVHTFRIPSEDAGAAIVTFGLQAELGIQIDHKFAGKRLAAVSGEMSVDQGLRRLLAGSDLTYVYIGNRRGVVIVASSSAPQGHQDAKGTDERPSTQQPSQADSKVLVTEEIVVTAQKRVEKLQDVPISALVFSGAELSEQNLNSLIDIAQVAPSVNVVGSVGRSGALDIRGVGSGDGTAFDQSVGTFVDDIYHGRTEYSFGQVFDLDRVEILKGPQSTFFGNDAIAGAFNIVTKKPGDEFESSMRALYGTFGQYEAEGAVNVPVDDHLQIRAAVSANGEDGWLRNVNTGEIFPHENNAAARITTRFKSDDLEATLKVEGSQIRDGGGLFFTVVGCPPPAPFTAAGFCKSADLGVPQGLRSNSTSETPGQKMDVSTQEEVLTVTYRQWGHTFTSVSGFSAYHYQQNLDAAGTPVDEINASTPEHYSQASQELRVASDQGQRVEYLAGLYFQTDQLVSDTDLVYFLLNQNQAISNSSSLSFLVPYLPLAQDIHYQQLEHVYSAFASSTWHATQALSFSMGLRASQILKDYNWHLFFGTAREEYGSVAALPTPIATVPAVFGLGTPGTLTGNRADHAVTPSLHTQYQLAKTTMLYGLYNRGFKAGGFNAGDTSGQAQNLPYGPEHVNAYEVGLKSAWLDRKVLLDLAVFRSNYTDLQVTENLPNAAGVFSTTVGNAAAVVSQGVELDGTWIIGQHFSLSASGTYLDAHYISYPNASPLPLQAFEGQEVVNLSGSPTDYAPKWSGTLTGMYVSPLPAGYSLVVAVKPIATSPHFYDVLDQHVGAYVRLDSRLTLESPDGQWGLDVIGRNLTDRDIVVFSQFPQATAPGTQLEQKEQPRSIALQIRVKW